ncbi:hypothetical protein, partial [Streptomyces zaomyceticus]|uniref:hypothetical protein n=1 Tax=Streptomyces zaomyceticus TaxID=68286 RepID=UPI00369E878D
RQNGLDPLRSPHTRPTSPIAGSHDLFPGKPLALIERTRVEEKRRKVADHAAVRRVVLFEDCDQARAGLSGCGQLFVHAGRGVVQACGQDLLQQAAVLGSRTRVLARLSVERRGQALRALSATGKQAPVKGGIVYAQYA